MGLAMGTATIAIGFHWIVYTIHVFGGIPYSASVFAFFLFTLYSAIPFAIFAALVHPCGFGPLSLFPAIFWVTLEFWFPHLFPWHLASSQAFFSSLIQSADLVGPYGTGFLLVWFNTVLTKMKEYWIGREDAGRFLVWDGVAVSGCLVAALVYGQIRLDSVSIVAAAAPTLEVAAIQGNISIERKDDMAYLKTNLALYKALSEGANADLIIWPESALETWLPEGSATVPAELRPKTHPDMVFGVMSFARGPRNEIERYNSAFLIDRQGRVLDRYHKQILLAFGEYIPFASLIGNIPGMPAIGSGFTPGGAATTLNVSPSVRLAPLICYEDLMPALARRFVSEGRANLLINLTNDAWYGKTVAPWQHARLAQWRAIETRRAMVRSTNTGLTTVIAPTGEIRGSLPIFTEAVLTARVPLLEIETPYVRHGDWFALLMTAATLMVLSCRGLIRFVGRRNHTRTPF